MEQNVFAVLNAINCNEHTETKNGLTYLSWAWAWQMVKKNFPGATYTIYENNEGWNYFTDHRTCWVKTGVTIEGLEHIEYLPVMDFRNNSIPADKVTSFDVNKAIQRSLTKACARHGLGLYIYAGEDLPADAPAEQPAPAPKKVKKVALSEEQYRRLVTGEAQRQLTKDGTTCMQWYLAHVQPTDQEYAKFLEDVEIYRQDNNI